MKRTTVLPAAVLAFVLAACGSEQAIESPTPAATPTEAPTAEPTPSPTPTETAAPTDDGSGSGPTGSLSETLPDEVAGLERTEIPGMGESMEEIIASSLAQQGLDAEEVDFAFAMYGQGDLIVTGFAVPGLPPGQLETLARFMSGMQVEGAEDLEAETATVGGKEVLRMTVAGETQSVLMYISEGAVFTVVAESEDVAAELLSQLP